MMTNAISSRSLANDFLAVASSSQITTHPTTMAEHPSFTLAGLRKQAALYDVVRL